MLLVTASVRSEPIDTLLHLLCATRWVLGRVGVVKENSSENWFCSQLLA